MLMKVLSMTMVSALWACSRWRFVQDSKTPRWSFGGSSKTPWWWDWCRILGSSWWHGGGSNTSHRLSLLSLHLVPVQPHRMWEVANSPKAAALKPRESFDRIRPVGALA